jgi:hypothetical protein
LFLLFYLFMCNSLWFIICFPYFLVCCGFFLVILFVRSRRFSLYCFVEHLIVIFVTFYDWHIFMSSPIVLAWFLFKLLYFLY